MTDKPKKKAVLRHKSLVIADVFPDGRILARTKFHAERASRPGDLPTAKAIEGPYRTVPKTELPDTVHVQDDQVPMLVAGMTSIAEKLSNMACELNKLEQELRKVRVGISLGDDMTSASVHQCLLTADDLKDAQQQLMYIVAGAANLATGKTPFVIRTSTIRVLP